jgi:hypothetical protein
VAAAIDMPGAGERPEAAAEARRREGMSIDDALRDLCQSGRRRVLKRRIGQYFSIEVFVNQTGK